MMIFRAKSDRARSFSGAFYSMIYIYVQYSSLIYQRIGNYITTVQTTIIWSSPRRKRGVDILRYEKIRCNTGYDIIQGGSVRLYAGYSPPPSFSSSGIFNDQGSTSWSVHSVGIFFSVYAYIWQSTQVQLRWVSQVSGTQTRCYAAEATNHLDWLILILTLWRPLFHSTVPTNQHGNGSDGRFSSSIIERWLKAGLIDLAGSTLFSSRFALGVMPHDCMYHPPQKKDNRDDWLDPRWKGWLTCSLAALGCFLGRFPCLGMAGGIDVLFLSDHAKEATSHLLL